MSPRAPKNPDETPKPARKAAPASKAAPKTAAARKTTTTTRKRTLEAAPALPEVTPEEIAFRAYMISISGDGGDELENWLRAERELSRLAA